jgi:hypothetical protein
MYHILVSYNNLKDGIEEQQHEEFKCFFKAAWYYVLICSGMRTSMYPYGGTQIVKTITNFKISFWK